MVGSGRTDNEYLVLNPRRGFLVVVTSQALIAWPRRLLRSVFSNTFVSFLPPYQELNLESNELTTLSLQGLVGLRKLCKLDLGYNQISDIHPLCGLTSLTQLSLESNLLHT